MIKKKFNPSHAARWLRQQAEEAEAGNYHALMKPLEELAAAAEKVKRKGHLTATVVGEIDGDFDLVKVEIDPEMNDEGIKRVMRFVHGNNDELSDLWDYEASQQDMYHHSLDEVKIGLDVDMETGRTRIATVDGVELKELKDFT